MFAGFLKAVKRFYEENYKLLLLIPLCMFIFAGVQIGYQQYTTGSFLIKDISLKGGITLSINYNKSIDAKEWEHFLLNSGLGRGVLLKVYKDVPLEGLRDSLVSRFGQNFSVEPLEGTGFIIDTTLPGERIGELLEFVESRIGPLTEDNYSADFISDLEFSVRTLHKNGKPTGFIIDTSLPGERVNQLLRLIQTRTGKLSEQDYSVEIIGSALGKSFFRETFIALIVAFILMGIVVFLYFRFFIPSIAVSTVA